MTVGNSIRKSIDDYENNETESSILHACNAVDGTAKKLNTNIGSNVRFTNFIRSNYKIFGPMALPGIDLVNTRFPVNVMRPKAPGDQPDIADIIYGIHRCSHGHGDELPEGFELIPDVNSGRQSTRIRIEKGRVNLSDRIIFGLLAISVLSSANTGQKVPDGYHLSFHNRSFEINEWWGQANEFLSIVDKKVLPSVKLNFGDWMN